MLQVKSICYIMGIIIALLTRKISYSYWMILIRILYGRAIDTSHEKILCSQDIWARILILQRIWRFH